MLQTLKAKRRGEVASLRKGKGTQRSRPFQYSKAHAKVEEEKGSFNASNFSSFYPYSLADPAASCGECARWEFSRLSRHLGKGGFPNRRRQGGPKIRDGFSYSYKMKSEVMILQVTITANAKNKMTATSAIFF